MGIRTEPCSKVHAVVKQWMDQHPEMQGIWDAFDVQTGLDIVISIHQADGVRRLTLSDQQKVPALSSEAKKRIINWLENLSSRPTVQD